MRLRTGRGGAIAPASTITSWKGRRAALLLSAALLVGSPIANAADEATWTRYLDAGTSAYNRRDPDEATRQFELALKEAEGFGESDARLATTLAWLAELYRVQRRFDESERLIRRTISIDEKFRGPDHPDLGMSLESLALLYHTQNRQREMEPVLIRAITIYEKALGPQHQRVASSLNNLAALYRSIGRLNEAEPLVSRSLAIREKVLGMDHPDTVQSRNYLALLHRDMARARPTARQPVRQPEIVQQPAPPVAEVAPAPAPVQTPVPAPTVAPAPAAAPAPIAQSRPVEQPAPPVQAALPTPAPAPVAPPAKPAPPPVVAIAPAPVIQLSPPAPKPAPAPPSAPAIQPNSPPAQISAVTPAPQPSKPEPAREAAAVVPPALPVVVAPAPVPPAVPASPKSAPPAPQAALDPRPAPPPIQPAPVASRLYRSSLAMQMSLLGASGTQTSSAAVARAFEVMQLARNRHETGAVSRMAARFGRTDDGLARVASVREDLLDRWHGLDKTLMDVSGGAGVQRASGEETRLREELAGIDRQIAQQDVLIEQRVPGFRNYLNPETLPLAAAQTMLASDEALLSYMVDDNASYLVVVRSDRIALHTLDIGRNELGSIIKRLREQLDYPTGDDVARTVFRAYPVAQANQLYRRILGAAEPALQGASHLMIVADDSLNGLPFAALVTDAYAATLRDAEEHAKVAWLGRRYALTMLPSEGVLRSLRRAAAKPQATKPFAGFGDPLLGGEGRGVRSGTATRVYSRDALANVNQIWNFAPLPETRYALHAMADLLKAEPGDVHLQAEASESGVKRFDLSDYRVIAFATHGFMADDFKGLAESALVFTPPQRGTEADDGLLTASEIAQLKLNAELVILTATSTASADGTPDAEGVSGLARAFFHAGDRAVLATHWAVPSDATLKLVTRTLRERARGVGNAEALRRAMLPLMNGEDRLSFAHPSYWAPFMVIGEGRPASGQASAAVAPVNRDPSTVETTGGQASESSGPGFGRFFQGIFGGEPAKR